MNFTVCSGCGGGTRTTRPPGYEPGKLPTAPLRDVGILIDVVLVTGLEPVRMLLRRILSPLRLPIPPHELIIKCQMIISSDNCCVKLMSV